MVNIITENSCGESNTFMVDIKELENEFIGAKSPNNAVEIKRIKKMTEEFKDYEDCNSVINGFDIDYLVNF